MTDLAAFKRRGWRPPLRVLLLAIAGIGCGDPPKGMVEAGSRPDGTPLGLSIDLELTAPSALACVLYCDDGDWGPLHAVSGPFGPGGGPAAVHMEAQAGKHRADLRLRSAGNERLGNVAVVVRYRDSEDRNALIEVVFREDGSGARPEVAFTYLTEGDDDYMRLLEPHHGRLGGYRRAWEGISAQNGLRARLVEPLDKVRLQGTILVLTDGDLGYDDFPTALYPVDPADLTTVVFMSQEEKTLPYELVDTRRKRVISRFSRTNAVLKVDVLDIRRAPCRLELSWEYNRHGNDDLVVKDLLLRAYGAG